MDRKISYQVIKDGKIVFQGNRNSCYRALKSIAEKHSLPTSRTSSSLMSLFKSTGVFESGK